MPRRGSRTPLPRAFWIVWVGTLVNRLGTFVEPFLILYLTQERALSPSLAGLVLATWGAGALVSQILGGWFTDHVGRRATMAGSLLAAAAALLMLGAARDVWAIAAAAFVVGVTGDMYRPASTALVSDLIDPERRPYAFGLLYWAVNLGFSVAAVSAGFLAEQGYSLLFVLDALTCAGYALIVLIGIRRDPPRPPRPPEQPAATFRTALQDRVLLRVCVLTFAHATLYMQGYVTLPLATADAGLPARSYGTAIAVNGIAIVVLQPFVSRWLERFDRVTAATVAQVVMGVGFGLTAFASTTPGFVGTVLVWTIGEVLFAGFLPTVVSMLAPVDARGRYQGVVGTAFGAAALAGPAVGTIVYQWSPAVLWGGCAVLGAVTAIGWASLRAPLERRSTATVATP